MSEAPEFAKAADRVRSWIKNSGLSNAALAAQSGVDEKIIRLLKADKGNPTLETLTKLAVAMPANWQDGETPPKKRKAA